MTTAEQFLDACRAELGYREDPPNSNKTKYAPIAGHANGYAWCATFEVAMAKQAGLELPPGVAETAYTWTALSCWREAKQADPHPQVGAWAYFEIGNGHTGVVESFTDTTVTTIDGNTARDGSNGSDSNGGEVARKTRSRALVAGYGLPAYLVTSTTQYSVDRIGDLTAGDDMQTHVITIDSDDWTSARPELAGQPLDVIPLASVVTWFALGEHSAVSSVGINGELILKGRGQYAVVTHS